jgi:hypothetical protein
VGLITADLISQALAGVSKSARSTESEGSAG